MTCSISIATFTPLRHCPARTIQCIHWSCGLNMLRHSPSLGSEGRASLPQSPPWLHFGFTCWGILCSVTDWTQPCLTCVVAGRWYHCDFKLKGTSHRGETEGTVSVKCSEYCIVYQAGRQLLNLRLIGIFYVALISHYWEMAVKHISLWFFLVFYSCFDLIGMPWHLIQENSLLGEGYAF